MTTPEWDLLGLDTAWDSVVLSDGVAGVLADPRPAVVAGWAAECEREGRKAMLLSPHHLVTSYDHEEIWTLLPRRLARCSRAGRSRPGCGATSIAAWALKSGTQVQVRYRDDDGTQTRTETIH